MVAETGIEPATFGLWARRATSAPLRDIVAFISDFFFLFFFCINIITYFSQKVKIQIYEFQKKGKERKL